VGRKVDKKTVAETISELSKNLIDKNNGILLGQCLTAVGWVQNTIPKQTKGIMELPMTDTAGAGIAVGCALAGSRPVLVIRYQSFLWLNSSPIVMHAAKAKEIFGYDCPLMIRAIASESELGQGPLHANAYHSIFAHMPGLNVCSPMTPMEYKKVWNYYIKSKKPIFVSEHRSSYKSSYEYKDEINKSADVTIFGVSSGRINAIKAHNELKNQKIKSSFSNILWVKPLKISKKAIDSLKKSKFGIVIDPSYEFCGVSQSISYELTKLTGKPVYAMGLRERSPGVAKRFENGTPSKNQIIKFVKEKLNL